MCSHVLEHLPPLNVYSSLLELDASTRKGGILVLAGPLEWPGFWSDLTHVRPYNPEVFLRYLCSMTSDNSMPPVSQAYEPLELVYSWECDDGKTDQWKDDEAWPITTTDAQRVQTTEMQPVNRKAMRRNSWLLVLRKGKA